MMRSESTSAFGQPSETKLIFGPRGGAGPPVKVVWSCFRGLYADNPRALYKGAVLRLPGAEHVWLANESTEDTFPPEVRTVAELIAWLSGRGEHYAHAFEAPRAIRAAIDHTHVRPDAVIAGAREIALFPPMTGG